VIQRFGEELRTARLGLRRYRDEDREDFVRLFTDPAVMAHVGGALERAAAEAMFAALAAGTHRRALAAWTAHDERGHVGHAALLRGEGDAIELGYVVRRERWGQGFGSEIARALVAAALAADPGHQIIATVDTDHVASQRVLERAGLVLAERREDQDGAYDLYRLASPGALPDARDGLTRLERVILVELARAEAERGDQGTVPTAMLYGRVAEHVNVSVAEFQAALARLVRR
jgi:RimJ/RimL family protein N-acetyltransferase